MLIIMTAYRFTGKYDKGLDSSRVEFAPSMMERYFLGPLDVMASIVVWPDASDYLAGMPKHINEK